jgi:hypothetical protein
VAAGDGVTVEGGGFCESVLRGRSVIVVQQTAEPFTPHDAPVVWCWSDNGEDQAVAQALVVAFEVIMLDELMD